MPAPILTGLNDIAIDSGDVGNPTLIDGVVTFSDVDGDFNGARLVVTGIAGLDDIRLMETGTGPGQIAFDWWTGTIWYGGVVIAQMVGGYGYDMTITFNAQATAAGVETVIESLTYSNYDGVPGTRTLTYTFFDAAGNASGGGMHERSGAANPYFSMEWPPYVIDVNNDGKLDLVLGDFGQPLRYFRNTGTNTAPIYVEQTGAANPFAAVSGIIRLIKDMDNDGDLDVYVTASDGFLIAYRNTGSAASPVYTTSWLGFDPQSSLPLFGDVDNDGDIDAFVSDYSSMLYFQNTGTNAAPVWTQRTGAANPLNGVNPGFSDISMGDVDGDGDLDIVMMPYNTYTVVYLLNVGTAAAPAYAYAGNPFGRTFSTAPRGSLQDVDGDGDTDFLVRMIDGSTVFMRNDGPSQSLVITINDAPSVAQNDLIAVSESEQRFASVFSDNGSGIDTDTDTALVVTAINGSAANVNQQITLPSGAKVTLLSNGQMAYDPGTVFDSLAEGQTATDSFTYTVTGGDTATVTLQITGIAGTSGDDHIVSDGVGRTLSAGRGNDYVDGGGGGDTLSGGEGDDYLKGGDGADTLRGGAGNDTYVVDNAGDITDETGGGGTDLVWSRISWALGTGFENLTLGAAGGDIDGAGNNAANVITGNDSDNILQGLGGDDTLIGAGGADTLRGGNNNDSLDGGIQDDLLEGGSGQDDLIGGAGHDRLDGGTGGDDMVGGMGNDTYVVDSASDTVLELAGAGTDTVESSVTWALGDNVEHLILTVSGAINGTGNALRNTMTGNGGANTLSGGGEVDTLSGGAGNDTLRGDAGNDLLNGGADNDLLEGGVGIDTLDGGAGADTLEGGDGGDKLTGGTGADLFRFTNLDIHLTASAGVADRDTLLDLAFGEGDRIDLSAIDADAVTAGDQAFIWAVGNRFSKQAGELVLKYVASTNLTTLEMDVDGDGKADFRIAITGDHSGTMGNLYTGAGDTDGGWAL